MRGTVCNDARYRAVTTSVIGKHRCQLPGGVDTRYKAVQGVPFGWKGMPIPGSAGWGKE